MRPRYSPSPEALKHKARCFDNAAKRLSREIERRIKAQERVPHSLVARMKSLSRAALLLISHPAVS